MGVLEDLFILYAQINANDPNIAALRQRIRHEELKRELDEQLRAQASARNDQYERFFGARDTTQPWQKTLGVGPNATLAEAESAYKKLARQHHPDFGGELAKMQEINEAIRIARLVLKGAK